MVKIKLINSLEGCEFFKMNLGRNNEKKGKFFYKILYSFFLENKPVTIENINKMSKIDKNTKENINKKIISYKNINFSDKIKKEDLIKFVYDLTSENLTASSFKYAMRNLKNNQSEKEIYLLVK